MGFLVYGDGADAEQEPGLRSLLDLARENLTLKQQLKAANHELSRLQAPSRARSAARSVLQKAAAPSITTPARGRAPARPPARCPAH